MPCNGGKKRKKNGRGSSIGLTPGKPTHPGKLGKNQRPSTLAVSHMIHTACCNLVTTNTHHDPFADGYPLSKTCTYCSWCQSAQGKEATQNVLWLFCETTGRPNHPIQAKGSSYIRYIKCTLYFLLVYPQQQQRHEGINVFTGAANTCII